MSVVLPSMTFSDMRYALRSLLKQPGFFVVAVLTLALGIGINSALFTVFDAFVLKPLPLKHPETLVNFDGTDKDGNRQRLFSYLDFLDYQKQKNVLADVVAWNKVPATIGEAPPNEDDSSILAADYEHIFGQIVSTNYFGTLGGEMQLGHGFTGEEDKSADAAAVVVLSHSFWTRRFQSNPEIIGQNIRLKGQPFRIIGVAAPGFIGTTPDAPAFWAPLLARDRFIRKGMWGYQRWYSDRNMQVFVLTGRLANGVSRTQAQAALQLTTSQLAQDFPNEDRKTKLLLSAGNSFVAMDQDVIPLVVPLFFGFGLVLVIACANVANLLLARAIGRQREIAIRMALGAGRRRVISQLTVESLLLSLIGGALGLGVAIWLLHALYPIVISRLPIPNDLAAGLVLNLMPDWRIFTFTFFAAAASGLAAGLLPAMQATRTNIVSALKDERSGWSERLSGTALRNGLLVVQIAVCFALMLLAGLLIRNSRAIESVNSGMQVDNLVSVAVGMNTEGEPPKPEVVTALRAQLTDRLRTLPIVRSVSEAAQQPLSGRMDNRLFSFSDSSTDHPLEVRFNSVAANYFSSLEIPILRGRAFSADEVRQKARVIVISESTAKRFWPNANPVGQNISLVSESGSGRTANRTFDPYQIIGVVGDTRSRWVWQEDETLFYLPLDVSAPTAYLLVQTKSDPRALVQAIRELSGAIHPQLRASAHRVSEDLAYQAAPFHAIAVLSAGLGLTALLLASVGLYGVTSFLVASRTHEIGIRMALGAQPLDVLRVFIGKALKLTSVGVLIGLVLGVASSRFIAAVLIDISPVDPLAYILVTVLLAAVALLATYIPSRRATNVDPQVALRCD